MSSFTIDDNDSLFDYKDGSWQAGGTEGEFDGTSHSTNVAGAQVIFGPFNGTSIAVFGTLGPEQPTVHYFVDSGAQGGDYKNFSSPTPVFQQRVYTATSLDPTKTHKLQINLLDSSGTFTLDFVQIGSGNTAPTPVVPPPAQITAPSPPASAAPAGATSTSPAPPKQTNPSPALLPGSVLSSATITTTSVIATTFTAPNGQVTTSVATTTIELPTVIASSMSVPAPSGTPSGSSGSNVDLHVMGIVMGAIVALGLSTIGIVMYFRRRRAFQLKEDSKLAPDAFVTHPQKRPSLLISIPGAFSIRGKKSSFLPSHQPSYSHASDGSTSKFGSAAPFRPTFPAPAFMADDSGPDDSPIFDIKERPVSGATMTTRVTVGTSIGHRASEPYYPYQYPDLATPPLPPLPPSARATRTSVVPSASREPSVEPAASAAAAAAVASVSTATAMTGTMSTGIVTESTPGTSVNSDSLLGQSFNSTTGLLSGVGFAPLLSLPRLRNNSDSASSWSSFGLGGLLSSGSRTNEPRSDSEVDSITHRDGGVRLASNLLRSQEETPRRKRRVDLPPPYQDYF